MTKKPKLTDVADYAGVSRATASRALRNSGLVGQETKEKVLKAAEILKYRPNNSAQLLSGGLSDTICLLIPSLSRYQLSMSYYAAVIAAAEETATRHRLNLLIKNKQEIDDVFALLEQGRLGGVILRLGHNRGLEDRYVRRLRKNKQAFVAIGHTTPDNGIPAIRVDILGGARAVAHHFVERAYKKILFISGPRRNADAQDRYAGFRLGLIESGYSEANIVFAQGEYTPESGYRCAKQCLPNSGIEAVFASSDQEALGVLTYCASNRIQVPTDVAVAGYDDQEYAAYTWPTLTTVKQPMWEIGKQAVEQLVRLREGGEMPNNDIILAPKLVVRESTGGKE